MLFSPSSHNKWIIHWNAGNNINPLCLWGKEIIIKFNVNSWHCIASFCERWKREMQLKLCYCLQRKYNIMLEFNGAKIIYTMWCNPSQFCLGPYRMSNLYINDNLSNNSSIFFWGCKGCWLTKFKAYETIQLLTLFKIWKSESTLKFLHGSLQLTKIE